jgi:hypothetical protein
MPGALGKRRTDLSTDDMVRLYADGLSASEIGRRLDCNAVTVLQRLRKAGVEIRKERYPQLRGEDSPYWKGGRRRMSRGYWTVHVDGKQVLEHRYVMQQALGRELLDSEEVHHLNRDNGDNRLENLFVVTAEQHRQLHSEERRYCKSGHQTVPDELRATVPFLSWWLERHVFTCPKSRRSKGGANAA